MFDSVVPRDGITSLLAPKAGYQTNILHHNISPCSASPSSLRQAVDMGDSMFVHAFGAYFGLAVSIILYRRDASTEKEGSSHQSDMFAMIGEARV